MIIFGQTLYVVFLTRMEFCLENMIIFLHLQIDTMLITKIITIPDCIPEPLFLFMRYTLIGAIHLNKHAVGVSGIHDILPDGTVSSLKRKRIIERLSRGLRLHLIPWSQSRNRLIS